MLGASGPALATTAAKAAVPGLGWVSLGLDLLGGGVFGSTKTSSISAPASGYSGIGGFSPNNSFYAEGKPLIDLDEPTHVLIVGVLAIAGIYAIRKYKG